MRDEHTDMRRFSTELGLTAAIIMLLVAGTGVLGDTGRLLRERYLGPDGLPSEAAYRLAEGIAPAAGSETYTWQAVFKLTYLSRDLGRLDHADPVATDCYLVRTHRYRAPYRAVPVWDGRVYQEDGRLVVAAYTRRREQVVGHIGDPSTGSGSPRAKSRGDGEIVIEPGALAAPVPALGSDDVRYNPFTGQLWRREPGGDVVEQQHFYLPLPLVSARGEAIRCAFEIGRGPDGRFTLAARSGDKGVVLATCAVGQDTIMQQREGFAPQLGPGCVMAVSAPATVVEVRGELVADALEARGASLVMQEELPAYDAPRPPLRVDGDFSEWRSIAGIGDPRGDVPAYLDYNPDTDLLEFKIASDARHLYFYTRVAGRHGNTAPGEGRYYYYVYIDADRDPTTGYLPTRDDDCYYGVTIGDDCEAQFEFVGGRFIKTFFGFTGVGAEREVLAGRVQLGPSWYSKYDERGNPRDRYKVEYVQRGGKIQITEDYTEGTSDDIVIALSPDGSECEMSVELAGFLRDPSGRQVIAPGQRIDAAVGAEASGEARGNDRWGADSTAAIAGYYISPGRGQSPFGDSPCEREYAAP